MTETPPTSAEPTAAWPRGRTLQAVQVLRLPAALGLLALVAQPRDYLMILRMGLYARGTSFAVVWARITVAALAFALVVLVARRRTAPLPLLATEAVIAGALGFVPPYLWAGWLNHHPVSRVLDFEFAAPLAIAWFAIVITTVVAQVRGRAATARSTRRAATAGEGRTGLLATPPASLLTWLRIPALLTLLVVVAQQREELSRVWVGAGNFELVWAQLTIPALAFGLVALVGRRHRAPWPLLALEMVLAAALAFTPPHRWFGVLNWDQLALVLSFEFTTPLAIAWLAIAILTAVRQRAGHRPHAP